MVTAGGLSCAASYLSATSRQRKNVCNGCGPHGWLGQLVPDTIWGLNISEACNIHDWDYHIGVDRELADDEFRENLHRLIDRGNPILAYIRRPRVEVYYQMVRRFGGAFYGG